VFARKRRKWTADASDHGASVAFDVSHSAQLRVQQLAGAFYARPETATGWSLSKRQFVRQTLSGSSHQRLDLFGGERVRKYLDELGEEWQIRLRQKLFNFGCQFEHVKGPGCTRSSTHATYDLITLHGGELRPYGVGSEPKLGGDVVDGQATALKERDDSPRLVSSSCCLSIEMGHLSDWKLYGVLP
jgi:hypothetical protein